MAYTAPYISSAGLVLPTYTDILNDLIEQAKTIYGQDIYLSEDSQDYQIISVFALKIYDAMQLAQYVYNARSVTTAIGSALDALAKLSGITRKAATYSTCVLTLTGAAGTVIASGIAQDTSGFYWNLPSTVTIGSGGTATTAATCKTSGAIAANIGEINIIYTPTYGWTSVTNAVAAVIGSPVETDAELRARVALSSSQPSLTVLEGTKAAVAAVTGVTRYTVYENDTTVTDASGIPAHTVCSVVEGGMDTAVATAILSKKGAESTYGTTSVSLAYADGESITIKFYRPTYVGIDVVVNVKALTGYTSTVTTNIKAAIVAYLNSLTIGDDLPLSSLWGAALGATTLSKPTFSITSLTAARHGSTQGTTDIATLFYEITQGNTDYITVNVT